jgi:DNA repair photolyase
MKKERMYEIEGKRVPTWNPFIGCRHNCTYCYASDIAKRQKHRCQNCYDFVPHLHPDRLQKRFKKGETVFVCSMGDISFAAFDTFTGILAVISNQPKTTFYIQSKDPIYFREYLERFGCSIGDNVVLGTTIETNRNTKQYSNAPIPTYRYEAMKLLKHREYVTIEPIMDFDMSEMLSWLIEIKPEFVYIGYNSKDRKNKHLPEPSLAKTEALIAVLEKITEVRLKLIRKAWWEN